MNALFETFEVDDARDLIAEFPLAWVVGSIPGEASLLPLVGEYDGRGTLTRLLGHMSRRNALHASLRAAPTVTILFTGPHGYISPEQAGRRDWGPTWNYAQVVATGELAFLPEGTDEALSVLTATMEGDRWAPQELGERYAGMAAAVVAFRVEVTRLTGRFKLGQDERSDTFESIVGVHPDGILVRWMRRFARRRR